MEVKYTYFKDELEMQLAGLDRNKFAICMYHVDVNSPFFTRLRMGQEYNYHPMIKAHVEQVHKIHPEAEVIMFTDYKTTFDQDIKMRIVRLPVNSELIVIERTRSQQMFSTLWPGYALHIDTDMFIRRRFDDVYKENFSIGFTYRPEIKDMPINGGMILVRECQKAAYFLLESVEKIIVLDRNEPGKDLLIGYGEQKAFATQCEFMKPGYYNYGLLTDNIILAIFPAHKLNHTWDGQEQWADNKGPYALHKKGWRKLNEHSF